MAQEGMQELAGAWRWDVYLQELFQGRRYVPHRLILDAPSFFSGLSALLDRTDKQTVGNARK